MLNLSNMNLATIELSQPEPGVVVATLNRPERMNAQTFQMFESLEPLGFDGGHRPGSAGCVGRRRLLARSATTRGASVAPVQPTSARVSRHAGSLTLVRRPRD